MNISEALYLVAQLYKRQEFKLLEIEANQLTGKYPSVELVHDMQ